MNQISMVKAYDVVLLGAGSSKRFGGETEVNKILHQLNHRPVFDYSLRLFLKDEKCKTIWFVVKKSEQAIIQEWIADNYREQTVKLHWVYGGYERQDSVRKALRLIADEPGHLLIHDAARPFINKDQVEALLTELEEWDAVTLGIPATDSMKLVESTLVRQSLYRPQVWHIQTPQAFSKKVLKRAMDKAVEDKFYGNEEGELVERIGQPVKIVPGDKLNFKITTLYDYHVAQFLMQSELYKSLN